ncbi:MAG: type II toxin-antitoxin system VapC family toxin [Candidatus Eremiobacteraeota bacterium]|nr:type II toxin-antitoxin system VapC family toxin [Candidatus Eremiobacteraeota bacterium]MCW5869484.1 type II toxin-antitoxin system VapC family toxin [Candidatus Eremiobacteraeota bacterium]
MITSVDTNVLLDFLTAAPNFGPSSAKSLQDAAGAGRLVVCEIVFAEVSGLFGSHREVADILTQLGIYFDSLREESAHLAGQAFKSYRQAGGPRHRVIADFLIGAHAVLQADRLLTRDRGYYRTYFPKLRLL